MCIVNAALLALSIGLAATTPQRPVDATVPRPTRVLFLCPHGAAKSVLASTYFERLARERGLNVRVEAAGTEPDPRVSPAVAKLLQSKGYQAPPDPPRKVSEADVAAADLVISLGCDLKGMPVKPGTLREWAVPGPGEDLAGADAAIAARVNELVDELVKASRRP